jgi:hypothetical protein
MEIISFIKTHSDVISVIIALGVAYFGLASKMERHMERSDERWYTLLNKIHEIDKRMEVKFTQVDASLNQGK